MQKSSRIDLAKGKSTLTDDLLKWALSFGRFLIIVVEIVAFSAFIYRFALDRQISDLNDKIKNEQAIIEASKKQENTYRSLQERIATVKKISTTGNTAPKIIKEIKDITPAEITYNSYKISEGKLEMELSVSSFSSLTTFLESFKKHPQIASVAITGIDNSLGGNSVKVSLVAVLNGSVQ